MTPCAPVEHTNAAEHSQHIEAKAIDMRVAGVGAATLRDAALSLNAGGVGLLPQEPIHSRGCGTGAALDVSLLHAVRALRRKWHLAHPRSHLETLQDPACLPIVHTGRLMCHFDRSAVGVEKPDCPESETANQVSPLRRTKAVLLRLTVSV